MYTGVCFCDVTLNEKDRVYFVCIYIYMIAVGIYERETSLGITRYR
jgi:hypothetical protein